VGNRASSAVFRHSGFTLLEVILALAILAGAVAVLGEVSRLALRNAAAARDLAQAQLLAETKMGEIVAGITAPDNVENAQFESSSNASEQGIEAGWVYSISSESTDEDGLLSVRVTVTRNVPAAQHAVKFSLVRWVQDPNYTYEPPSSSTSSSSSSGS
jgi:type II secretion system protein I